MKKKRNILNAILNKFSNTKEMFLLEIILYIKEKKYYILTRLIKKNEYASLMSKRLHAYLSFFSFLIL